MNDLNSILIEGNCTKDPELSQTAKGTPVCNFSVASNRYYKNGEKYEQEVSFFQITAYSSAAEICARELKKGRGVRVVGRLKQDRWIDDNGVSKSKVYVISEHIDFKPMFSKEK